MYLGAHIGIADGLAEAPAKGHSLGCEAIQIFSKSPQVWESTPIPEASARAFHEAVEREGLKATAIHHGYLANLASPKKPALGRSRRVFLDEVRRAELLGVDGLIFHPGAHMGDGVEAGVARIAESVNLAIEATPGFKVRLLLENAAGQGSAMGRSFGELAGILGKVEDRSRVGITLDTCHLLASGLDFRTEPTYGALVDRLETEIGTREVRAFHLNDAKEELGSHRDRHENIGAGRIGLEGFRPLVIDPRWAAVPGYLETPLGEDDYGAYERDLAALRSVQSGSAASPLVVPPPASRRRVSTKPKGGTP
ncbi:MAG: deoxyribonuclease IV [Thermoplasmata archaeon]|nr:deoxyribonuclease IV [Thermoplasmata archaeon]